MEILAYEMKYSGDEVESDIELIAFRDEYFEEYKNVYNKCFYEMKKFLDVNPYYFYSSINELEDKKEKIFILKENEELIGSVAIIDDEIDDLIVNPKYQGKRYGKNCYFMQLIKCKF